MIDSGRFLTARPSYTTLEPQRSKNVVHVATNLRKFRMESEQKGEKRLAGFCYNLLPFSGLRRLRQDLATLVFRLEGRRSIQLSYGRVEDNAIPWYQASW